MAYNNLAKIGRSWCSPLKVENFNGKQSDLSQQIHVLSGFKRFALACRNTNHRQTDFLSIIHTPLLPVSLLPPPPPHSSNWLHSLTLCHTLSVSLTIALFGLIEEYETAWRDISAASPTHMPIHFAAGDLTS